MKVKNKFSFGPPQDRPLLWATDTRCFLHPPFSANGHVTPNLKNLGGCNFGNPLFGPLGVTCPFLKFSTPEHQRTTWTNLTPTDTQPIASKPTYLWANLNWTRSLASPSPTLGALCTNETQHMARDSYTLSTLGATDPPHRGRFRPPSSTLHHEVK